MRLTVRGFQSIKEADIEVRGLTALVGPSNVGKTAIVRAFLAALSNLTGRYFIPPTYDESIVGVDDDGLALTWRKSRKTATLTVNGEEYEKTRGEVIPEVEQHGFRPVAFGKLVSWVQFARQDDPYFLLTEPAGRISEVLSTLAGIGPGVVAVQAVQTDLRRLAQKANEMADEAAAAERAVVALDGLDAAEEACGRFDSVLAEQDGCWRAAEVLRALSDEHLRRLRVEAAVSDLPSGPDAAALGEMAQRLSTLRGLRAQYSRAFAASEVEVPAAPDAEGLKPLAEAPRTLRRLREAWEAERAREEAAAKEQAKEEAVLVAIDGELAAFPSCPLCGRSFDA